MEQIDLRLLAAGFAKHFGLPEQDIRMLETCPVSGLSLAILRVIARFAKSKKLLTEMEESRIISLSKPRMTPVTALMNPVKITTSQSDPIHDTISEVDLMLVNPALRACVPNWFVVEFWPGMLRKIAQGGSMSEREMSITRSVVGEVHDKANH